MAIKCRQTSLFWRHVGIVTRSTHERIVQTVDVKQLVNIVDAFVDVTTLQTSSGWRTSEGHRGKFKKFDRGILQKCVEGGRTDKTDEHTLL